MQVSLHPHPGFPSDAVSSLEVDVARDPSGGVQVTYSLSGDIGRVKVPAHKPAARADNLWQHTCFEAFFAVRGSPEYWEFNFSPSTCWAAYHFSDYRHGMDIARDVSAPKISVTNTAYDVVQTVGSVIVPTAANRFHVGLCAVIEETDGRLSYWALSHPSDKPDFHHRAGFVLDLTALEIS